MYGLQRPNNYIFDLSKTPIYSGWIEAREEIVFKFIDQPLPTSDLVIIFTMLLDLDVGEVRLKIGNILGVIRFMRETSKSATIEPSCQLTVTCT